jgi:ABC-type polysaccharide/polyol phosphate export permease
MVPLALVCFISGQSLAWSLPLVLVVGVALALLTAGLGLALSIMFIRFDDTRNVVNVMLMILMYLTPIFYPVSIMNETMQRIIHWNPLTSYLEIFRWAFSNNATPTLFSWLYMSFCSIFALLLGTFVFRKYWPRTVAML